MVSFLTEVSRVIRNSFAYTNTKAEINDQHLAFATLKLQSIYFRNPTFQFLSSEADLPGRNPESRFSHNATHIWLP